MATWNERFKELSGENGRQVEIWKAGNRNHDKLIDSGEAIAEFFRQYLSAGEPARDTEMP